MFWTFRLALKIFVCVYSMSLKLSKLLITSRLSIMFVETQSALKKMKVNFGIHLLASQSCVYSKNMLGLANFYLVCFNFLV